MPWFREYVAFTCGTRLSMPLGVAGRRPGFIRVFHGTRLHRLWRGGCLVLLAPRDPVLFYESIVGGIWDRVNYEGGVPVVDPSLGSWFSCNASLAGEGPYYDLYFCDGPRPLALAGWEGYSRVYGCLVELLVAATKALAGIRVPEGYAEGLAWCVERSSLGDPRVREAVEWALQTILGAMR